MSVECRYAVLVTVLGSEGLEYSFPLYANLSKRAEMLAQLIQLAIRTASPVVIEGVPINPLRVSRPFEL